MRTRQLSQEILYTSVNHHNPSGISAKAAAFSLGLDTYGSGFGGLATGMGAVYTKTPFRSNIISNRCICSAMLLKSKS